MPLLYILLLTLFLFPAASLAQVPSDIPGSADAGRVDLLNKPLPEELDSKKESFEAPQNVSGEAPEGAKNIYFELKDVRVNGVSAFTKSDIEKFFKPHIGQHIPLSLIWDFAAKITELYRENEYFLSRAYVPAQDIDGGVVTINVIEGYVGRIILKDKIARSYLTDMAEKDLLSQKPAKASDVESFLLRLNDLPGLGFRAVLAQAENASAEEGGVDLILQTEREWGRGLVRVDNNGSRFLGPHQVQGYYEASLIPLHKTALTVMSSAPMDELKNGALKHSVSLTPSLMLEVGGSLTSAHPGYTLKPFDLKSRSVSWETALAYQWLRQRDENLSLRIALNGRNTTSDLAGSAFTRDRIVAFRAGLSYDLIDGWAGQNILGMTLSHGVDGLGASEEAEPFLSRAQAKPDFTKLEISATRAQALPSDFILQGSISGQIASGPLYSSEEYGYGGQVFGRAYDSSELTGDEGISASLELQYGGWRGLDPIRIAPFAFYDIGKVWNEDAGSKPESAASAGLGLRFETKYQISGEFAVAFPLTQSIDNPLQGGNGKNPRIMFQISKQF